MPDNYEPQIAQALQDISTSVSTIVSEEIALAKAEVSQKATTLGVSAAIAGAAGAFLMFALIMGAHTLAWALFSLTGGPVWLGYFIATIIFIILGVIAGFVAMKLFKRSSPPVPTMAIAEAQATKDAVTEARRNA